MAIFQSSEICFREIALENKQKPRKVVYSRKVVRAACLQNETAPRKTFKSIRKTV